MTKLSCVVPQMCRYNQKNPARYFVKIILWLLSKESLSSNYAISLQKHVKLVGIPVVFQALLSPFCLIARSDPCLLWNPLLSYICNSLASFLSPFCPCLHWKKVFVHVTFSLNMFWYFFSKLSSIQFQSVYASPSSIAFSLSFVCPCRVTFRLSSNGIQTLKQALKYSVLSLSGSVFRALSKACRKAACQWIVCSQWTRAAAFLLLMFFPSVEVQIILWIIF